MVLLISPTDDLVRELADRCRNQNALVAVRCVQATAGVSPGVTPHRIHHTPAVSANRPGPTCDSSGCEPTTGETRASDRQCCCDGRGMAGPGLAIAGPAALKSPGDCTHDA